MVESRCQLHSFDQSINDWTITWNRSPPKNLPEMEPNSRYSSLNYLRLRIELASVLAIKTLFWRIRCIGNRWEESENESSDLLRFKHFPDLPLRIVCYTLAAFDYFFPYFNSIIYPTAILFYSQNWEKAHREWQFWLERKLMMVYGRRWGSYQKLTFFLSSSLGWNGLKKDSTSHNGYLEIIESYVDE